MLFETDKSINRNTCLFSNIRVNTKKDNFYSILSDGEIKRRRLGRKRNMFISLSRITTVVFTEI